MAAKLTKLMLMRLSTRQKLSLAIASLAFCFFAPMAAFGLEFRSIAPKKVLTYDAPSIEAEKLFILNAGYPVEVIVDLNNWVKVRDALGGLSWVESHALSPKRMLIVMAKTDIKASENADASLVATAEKDVILELLNAPTKLGWIKVKHRDGVTGYLPTSAVWGLN
jgi:SH3-like domain-containing protein